MIVTNDNGDEAHYKSAPNMSVEDYQKSNLTIFPNPVKNHLYIENLSEPVEIEIYNLSGKVLLSKKLNESDSQINVSELSEDVYLYQLSQNGQKIKTGKLVKK